MIVDVLVAVLVVGAPVLALGVLLAPWCGSHPAARALGPVAALGVVVVALRVLSELGVYGDAKLVVLFIAGALAAGLAARRRTPVGWLAAPSLAAAAVVVLFALPLHDREGGAILGYNEINDSHVHAAVAHWLAEGAPELPPQSSTAEVVAGVDGGYPTGAHELVAVAVPLVPDGILGAYQPVLALVVALGAFVAYWALRRARVPVPLAVGGAVAAAGGYLQYGFYSEALLPQMAATPLVFGAVALGAEAVASRRAAPAVLAALTALAAVLTYSLGVGVYLGPAAAVLLAAAVLRSPQRARLLAALGAGALLAAIVALVVLRPLSDQALDFIREARTQLEDPNPAHLPGPADRRLVWGSWVGPDLRFDYTRTRVTEVGIVIAAGLAVAGLVVIARRRLYAPALLLGTALAGYLVIRSNASIYWVAKSYQMVAFPLACVVVVGAAGIARLRLRRLPLAGPAVAAVLLAGYGYAVWLSLDAARAGTAYSNPELRELSAFAETGSRGLGLGLVHDDLVKTELPTMDLIWHTTFSVRDSGVVPERDRGWRVVDVDMLRPDRIAGRDYIVEQRLGGLSQPSPPFRLTGTTASYRLWTRPRDATAESARIPVEPPGATGGVVVAPGERLALPAVGPAAGVRIGVRPHDGLLLRAPDFAVDGSAWTTWIASGNHLVNTAPGTGPARAVVRVGVPGRYRVTVAGSTAPGFRLVVAGTAFGPDVPTFRGGRDGTRFLGLVELPACDHVIELHGPSTGREGRETSYVQGVSLERDQRAPPTPVCIGEQRFEAAWDRPVDVADDDGTVELDNCGPVPVLVDSVEPLAVAPS